MSIRNDLQKLYIGYLGRAADKDGLDYWEAQIEAGAITLDDLRINWVNEQPEYAAMYGDLTRAQTAGKIYENLFKRAPDEAGLDYWVNGEGAAVPVDQLIMAFMNGAQGTDVLELDNQVEVANYYTANIGDNYSIDTARNILKQVSFEANSVAAAKAQVDTWAASGVDGKAFTLTTGQDTIMGTGADDVFKAPIVQNDLGAVTNTFESGDVLDGGGGRNKLEADLTFTVSGGIPVGPAISATTDNIQEVYFRAQSLNIDTGVQSVWLADRLEGVIDDFFNDRPWGFQFPAIDAENMTGVEQWWSQNSRSDLYIEDVRSLPEDTFIGMRGTDHMVSYAVDFDAAVLLGRQFEADSTLVFQLVDQDNPELQLEEFPIQGIRFVFNGESYNLTSEAMKDADTYEDFVAALEVALDEAGLGDLEVVLQSFIDPQGNEGAQIVITDPDAGIFANPGINFDQEELGGAGQLFWRSEVGAPEVEDKLVETNVVLDLVGRMDQGGILDIGGMSNKGVEVFNVLVGESSWLTALQSTSRSVDPDTGRFDHLQEVYVSHLGDAQGDLVIGWQEEARQTDFIDDRFTNVTNLPTGGRVVPNGLWDVRVFDAEGFTGGINIGVSLTDASFDRYLDFAEEPVQFKYLGGDGGNLFTFAIDGDLASDPDFRLDIVGGAENDRFNLVGEAFDLQYISIDGGGGDFNTLETSSDIGLTEFPETIPMAFENIQKLVLAGSNDVDAGMENLPGVEELWIATEDGASSIIYSLDTTETKAVISGKNQTALPGDSNENQDFGDIEFLGSLGSDAVITLQNTARLNGILTVEGILIDDWFEDGELVQQSEIRTLTLESTGRRDTTNIVQNFDASRVTTLNLEGTQDLAIHVSDMATLPTTGGTPPLTITGEALEGDLLLALNGGTLNRGNLDVITGTEGDNDFLALYGLQDGTVNPIISGFETIQFGWTNNSDLDGIFDTGTENGLAGPVTFNAANASDTDTYIIGIRGGGNELTLDNLKSGVTVQLGDPSGVNVVFGSADNILNAAAAGSELNLIMSEALGSAGGNLPTTEVNGFQTINFDVETTAFRAGIVETRRMDLVLDEDARVLNITGGGETGDSITLEGELPATLETIDMSGYGGEVFLTIEQGDLTADPISDITFIMNGYDAEITLNDGDNNIEDIAHNSIFVFTGTEGTVANPTTWTIDNFVPGGGGGATLSNVTRLDLAALGIDDITDLTIVEIGGNTVITSEAQSLADTETWQITLVGVDPADVEAVNIV